MLFHYQITDSSIYAYALNEMQHFVNYYQEKSDSNMIIAPGNKYRDPITIILLPNTKHIPSRDSEWMLLIKAKKEKFYAR